MPCIEYAGKAKAAGPEVKRGRTDLAETLWQTSNPYKDGRSLGDQWMEAKGKQRVEGPEMRRGRRVLPSSPMPYVHAFISTRSCASVTKGVVHQVSTSSFPRLSTRYSKTGLEKHSLANTLDNVFLSSCRSACI